MDWLTQQFGPKNQSSPGNPSSDQPLFDSTLDVPDALDLSHLDIVLPSGRAISRLRELLERRAEDLGVELHPPALLSVGELPAQLTTPTTPYALDFEQTLAWASVLARADKDQLSVLVPTPPAVDATTAWLELGGTVRRLHTSLAAEAMSFSDVLELAEASGEQRRWQFLTRTRKAYLAELASADRVDPNAAALDAVQLGLCQANRHIIMLGTTDLSKLTQSMLGQLDSRVTALIAAPEDLKSHFNRFGALQPQSWQAHELPLEDDQLIAAGAMSDQSQAVAECLAEFGQDFSVDQITIGVTDESQVAPIENHCTMLGVETYRHLGRSVSATGPGRLMDLIVAHLQRRSWRSLAALARHADVHSWLEQTVLSKGRKPSDRPIADPLVALDQLLANAFPRRIDGDLPEVAVDVAPAIAVRDAIENWLAPLLATSKTKTAKGKTTKKTSARLQPRRQPIGRWSRELAGVLRTLYPHLEKSPNPDASDNLPATRTRRAYLAITRLLERFESLSEMLDTPVDGVQAAEMLATRIADLHLADLPAPNDIEVLGWLDLALDDAPALVVCGLNHPFVPEAMSGDPFLPQALRASLSQSSNDRRYARDVHTMHQLLTSRKAVRFIVGSHSADGSPTPPSRLFAAATPDDAARRVCRLLTQPRAVVPLIPSTKDRAITLSRSGRGNESVDTAKLFLPPTPEPGKTISTLSVTAFSAYLTCPYRFYLRHVLKLRPLDDAALELAANQFGDLVHGALEWFGESDAKHETDLDTITDALIEHLHLYAKKFYGQNAQATVQLQVRQAERRLKVVAEQQAKRVAEGWRIHAVEASVDELDHDRETGEPKKPTGILIDGQFTGLRGRFDRIDHHPESGRWAILDYKTHGFPPEKKHLKTQPDGTTKWIDLQLPLYRRLIPDLGIDADPVNVELGYFNVAEKDSETKINIASFTPQQFADADELILWCVRQIRDCKFEPTDQSVQYDDYEMMLNESGTSSILDDELEETEQ